MKALALNGTRGLVVALHAEKSRYAVQLDGDDGPPKLLKPGNLVVEED